MGGDKKATTMVLKVDLQCSKCYRKIKRVLCQFPQIQDQVFDEKANTVTIKVVCCSPECIKKNIAKKGGDTVKSIQIIEIPDPDGRGPPPPPPPTPVMPIDDKTLNDRGPPPPPPPEPVMPINGGTKNDGGSPPPLPPSEPVKLKNGKLDVRDPPPPPPPEPVMPINGGTEKSKDSTPPPPPESVKPKDGTLDGRGPAPPPPEEPQKPKPDVLAAAAPVSMPYVQGLPVSSGGYHPYCSEGYYQYDGYCGRPVYDSYGGGRSYQANRCDYFSDENAGACAIM